MKGYLVTVAESNSRSIFVSGESAQSDEQASELVKQYYENNRIAVGSKYLEDFDVSSVDIDSEHLKYMGDNISTLEEALAEVPDSPVHQSVQPDSVASSELKVPPSRPSQQSEVAAFGAFSSTPQSSQSNLASREETQVCPTKLGDIIELNGKRFEAIDEYPRGDFRMMALDSFGEASVTSAEDCANLFYEDSENSRTAEWFNSLTADQKGVMKEHYPDIFSEFTGNLRRLHTLDREYMETPPRDKAYFAIGADESVFLGINTAGWLISESPKESLAIYPAFIWISGKTCNGKKVTLKSESADESNLPRIDTSKASESMRKLADFPLQYGYYLFNFCATSNSEEYIKLLPSTGLSITNQKNIELSQSDITQIDLYDCITARMFYSNMPFIYFVDNFRSLCHNERYCEVRDVSKDIVVDKQWNILPLSQIQSEDSQVCPTKVGDVIELNGKKFEAINITSNGDFEMMALDSFGRDKANSLTACHHFFYEKGKPSRTAKWFDSLIPEQKSVMKEHYPDKFSKVNDILCRLHIPDTTHRELPPRDKAYYAICDCTQLLIEVNTTGEISFRHMYRWLNIYPMFTWLSGKTCLGRKVTLTETESSDEDSPVDTDLTEDNSPVCSNESYSSSEDSQVCPTKLGDIIELNGKRFEAIAGTTDVGFKMIALDSFGNAKAKDLVDCMYLFYEDNRNSRTAAWFNSLTPEQQSVMKKDYTGDLSVITKSQHRLYAPDTQFVMVPPRDKAYFVVRQSDNVFFGRSSDGEEWFRNPKGTPFDIYPMFDWLPGKKCNGRKVTSTDTESAGEDSSKTVTSDSSAEAVSQSSTNTNPSEDDSQVCPTKIGDIIELNGKRFEAVDCAGWGDFEMMALDSFGEARVANTKDGMNLFYEDGESSRTANWFNSLTPEQKSVMQEVYTDDDSVVNEKLHKLHAPDVKSSGMPSRDKDYSALSRYDEAFFRIYLSGEVGLKNPTTPLAIYPMFIWSSDKKCNGRKVTVTKSKSSEEDSQIYPTKVGDIIELNGKRFEAVHCIDWGNFAMMALDSFGEASVTNIEDCMNLFYENSERSRTAEWFNTLTPEQKDVMKEDYPDMLSEFTENLHRLYAPTRLLCGMPSRDKTYFAVKESERTFFGINSDGVACLINPEKPLDVYPMFTWLSGKTLDGRKVTSQANSSEEDSPVSYNNTNSSVSEASQVCPTKVGDIIELNGKRFEAVKCTFDGNFSMMSLDSFGEARAVGIENCMNLFYEDSENSRTSEWFNTLTPEQKSVMKEDYPDNLSFGLDNLRRLNAPNVLFMQPPSRDKNYFAISDFATEVVEIYSTGEVGIKDPTEQLAIYPTFIWLSDKTCNGRKVTSTETSLTGESAPSQAASSEPYANVIKADDLLFKESDTSADDVDEQQTVNWGDFTIFSHYNKNDNKIHIDVKNKSGEVLYSKKISPYLEEGMISHSQFKNGDLDIIFDEGKVNKCIGFCLYLEYSYPGEDRSTPIFYSIYLEYLADKGTIEEYRSYPWNFDEMGCEPIYSEEEDRIVMSDYKNGGRNF